MAAFEYKIETIEDYDDDAITEAALNALSFGGWELKTVTYQPDETSGKSTATLIYIKNLSSSSSSLSSSTSSSSSSTSSNSDAPFMGAGWPYLPDAIEVTIGDRWYFDNVEFVEDEVMILKRYGEDGGGIFYSEDGTLNANESTNRLRIKIEPAGSTLYLYWTPATGTGTNMWYEWAAWVAISDPYNFKSFWDTNPSFNDYANTSYFDVTTSSGFSPYLKLQGEIFKTYTFVTYSSSSSSSSLSSSSSSSVSSSSSSVSSSSSSSSSSSVSSSSSSSSTSSSSSSSSSSSTSSSSSSLSSSSSSKSSSSSSSSSVNIVSFADMWFDAANTDATSSGQEISTWSDSSVNSLSATTYIHGLQTLKPIYLENQLNGYPVIRFPKSGSNYASIKTVPFAFTETLIVICVIKQTYTSPAGTAFMDASQSGPPAGFPRFWGLYQWAGGQLRVKVGGWTSSLAVSSGQWGVITCYINGFSSWIRINQGTKSTGLLESLLAASGLQMGNFFSGDIAELILDTNSSLTEAEITGIENYLMDKYSV